MKVARRADWAEPDESAERSGERSLAACRRLGKRGIYPHRCPAKRRKTLVCKTMASENILQFLGHFLLVARHCER